MTTYRFSKWISWNNRNSLTGINFPGVYCIAISETDLTGTPFDWLPEIKYIGMTNSKSGLKGRLNQFDNTINGKTWHGGADRFLYKYSDYNSLCPKLYVAVQCFECNVQSNKSADLIIMGEVARFEYVCFAEFVKKYSKLP